MTVTLPLPRTGRSFRVVRRWAPAAILLTVSVLVVIAPSFAPADPEAVTIGRRLLAPGPDALLGTDQLGRDVLSRLLADQALTAARARGDRAAASAAERDLRRLRAKREVQP